MDLLNQLMAPLEQLWHSPACVLIIVPISIVAAVWEMMQKTPSKYIPAVCLILGMALYPSLTPVSTVPIGFPVPRLVLVLNGLILGFVAIIAHKYVVKRIIDKFAVKQDIEDSKKPTPPK